MEQKPAQRVVVPAAAIVEQNSKPAQRVVVSAAAEQKPVQRMVSCGVSPAIACMETTLVKRVLLNETVLVEADVKETKTAQPHVAKRQTPPAVVTIAKRVAHVAMRAAQAVQGGDKPVADLPRQLEERNDHVVDVTNGLVRMHVGTSPQWKQKSPIQSVHKNQLTQSCEKQIHLSEWKQNEAVQQAEAITEAHNPPFTQNWAGRVGIAKNTNTTNNQQQCQASEWILDSREHSGQSNLVASSVVPTMESVTTHQK